MVKARIAWGFWLGGTLLLYLYTGGWFALALLAASVVIPVCAILAAKLSKTEVAAAIRMPNTAARGETAEGVMTLQNRGRFPTGPVAVTLEEENRLTKETAAAVRKVMLPSRGSESLPFRLRSDKCGGIRLRVKEAVSYDILGLSKKKLDTEAAVRCTVLPDTFPVVISAGSRMSFDAEGTAYSQDKSGYDTSETFRIRDYRPGDSPRSIHWKLSAKLERMMVKEPSLPLETSYIFLFEGGEAKDADILAEAFCSVVQSAAEEGISFSLGRVNGETGLYEKNDVRSEEELRSELYRFLAYGAGEDVLSGYLEDTDNQYTHVLLFSCRVPENIEALSSHAERSTLFLCGEAEKTERLYGQGLTVLSFDRDNYADRLSYVEI